jgi:flagella basal body P-ring formation protein FlgA
MTGAMLKRRQCASMAIAASLAWPAFTGTQGLEELLRERRADVSRWQVQPLANEAGATRDFANARVGRIGARTPVRFADGRVRWYAVAGFRDVLVRARSIESGAPLSDADTRLESRDVLALGCEPVAAIELRWRARRRLAPGEVLCDSTIEPAPDVERNRAVTLTAHSGGIQVSRVLIATADARAGERVRLRDKSSGDSLIGIVTGPGAASVQAGAASVPAGAARKGVER